MQIVKTEYVWAALANLSSPKKIRLALMIAIAPQTNTASTLLELLLTPTARAFACPTAPPTTTALLVKNALKDAASPTTTATQPTTAAIAQAGKFVTVRRGHAAHHR